MSDDSYLLDGNDRKKQTGSRWFGRLLKFIFIIIAFFMVIITVLANMGGSNDMLREGVGKTIQQAFGGRPVTMKKLVYMGFFPTAAIDIEDVLIFDKPEDSFPIMRLKKFQAYMPFWNVATSTPRLTKLYLEGFESIRGVFFPSAFLIERIYIDHDVDEEVAKLRGRGKIGVHSWDFSIGLEISGSKGKYQYMLLDDADLVLDVADVHFEGIFSRRGAKYYKFKDFNLEYDNKMIGGDLVISSLGDKLLKVKTTLKTISDKTNLQADLAVKFIGHRKVDLSGKVNSDSLYINDFIGDDTVFSILSRLREIAGYSNKTSDEEQKTILERIFGPNIIDLDFNLNNVDIRGHIKENLEFNLTKTSDRIKFGPVFEKKNMFMPTIMLLRNEDENKMISFVQNGRFDTAFAKLWFNNLPDNILGNGSVDVKCGIAEFSEVDDGLKINSFAINADPYNIGVKEKTLDSQASLFDLHFTGNNEVTNLKTIELSTDIYNFVQGSFQSSKEGSPCSDYISVIENKTDKEASPNAEKTLQGNSEE